MVIYPSRPLSGAHPPTWADGGFTRGFASGRHALSRMNAQVVGQYKHLFVNMLGLT